MTPQMIGIWLVWTLAFVATTAVVSDLVIIYFFIQCACKLEEMDDQGGCGECNQR